MELSDLDLAWLAGFIEGDGWIGVTRAKTPGGRDRPRLKVTGTDLETIERVARYWNRRVHGYYPSRERLGRKMYYEVNLCGEAALHFLTRIKPLMSSRRREQIEKALSNA